MKWLADTVIVVGLASSALLWLACALGASHVLWDTFGERLVDVYQKIRSKLTR